MQQWIVTECIHIYQERQGGRERESWVDISLQEKNTFFWQDWTGLSFHWILHLSLFFNMIIMLWCILCFFTKHGLRTLDISTWWWSRIIIDLTPNPTVCREQLAIFHRTQTWHLKCRSSPIVEIWSSTRNLVEMCRVLGSPATWGIQGWVTAGIYILIYTSRLFEEVADNAKM